MARGRTALIVTFILLALFGLSAPPRATAVNITVNGALGDLDGSGDGGAGEAAVLQAAVACWAARVPTNRNFTLTVTPMSLTGGTLGTGFTSAVDASNIPTAGTINIDNDGSTTWSVDATPNDAAEFTPDPNSQWRFINGPAGADLLSAVLHEIGHAMGWLCGAPCMFTNPNYDAMMNPAPGSFVASATCVAPFPVAGQPALAGCVFLQEPTAPALNVSLRGDGLGTANQIVNELSHPGVGGDMMLGFLNNGSREIPSFVDVDMFRHAYGDAVNRPPTVNAGADITAECSTTGGANVTLDATATTDPEGDALTFGWTCPGIIFADPTLAAPSAFFPNNQTITCRVDVTDLAACNPAADTVNVTVQDTTAPVITCPANLTDECSATGGTPATDPQITAFLNGATAVDACDAIPNVSANSPPSFFPLGVTAVGFSAADDDGNTSSCSANVTIVDTTPPVIGSLTATPDTLWAPNHTMVPVSLAVTATDVCDATPVCQISGVTSNEAVNALGDGNTSPDWQVTGALTVNLRAERSGLGSGRIYSITVQCGDGSGNSSTATVGVTVSHDQRAGI